MINIYKNYFFKKAFLRIGSMASVITFVMLAIQSTEALEHLEGASMSFFIYYLSLSLPTVLIIVFALVFPIGLFWTISHLRDDGEILAMQTVGVKERVILTWVLECGLFAFLSIWILASVVEPMCINQMSKAVAKYSRNHFFSMLKPKAFNVQGGNVLYASEVDPNTHKLKDVFILQSQPNTWFLLNSKTLKENHNGSVTLNDGESLRYNIENDVLTDSEFSTFNQLNGDPATLLDIKIEHKRKGGRPLVELWQNKNQGKSLARILWMVGLPSIAFFMTMMAAHGMFTPPRVVSKGSASRFSMAMLLNIIILMFFQRQAEDGAFSHMPVLSIVMVPLLMMVVVYFMGNFKQVKLR